MYPKSVGHFFEDAALRTLFVLQRPRTRKMKKNEKTVAKAPVMVKTAFSQNGLDESEIYTV